MQEYDELNHKEGIGISSVYAIAKLTDTKQGKRPMIAHGFVHEQAKDSFYHQASCTVRLT